jgi:xanthine dehydrogenase accessory factor
MDSVDLEVLKTAVQWSTAGFATTLGVVVRTWGSAPRPVGSMLVIREDGHLKGSVSGGCIEDDLMERVRAGTISQEHPTLTTYGVSADEAQRFGLPCGGTLQLVLEPVRPQSLLPDLLNAIDRFRHVVRHLDLSSGEVTLETGKHRPDLEFDGQT